jgi:hypothetical protein
MGSGALSQRVKLLGNAADHPTQPTTKVKKEWRIITTPLLCLRVFDKVRFYFTLIRRTECEATWLGKGIQRFIRNCSHHLQKHYFSLNMEAEGRSETLLSIYKTTRCHYPEYVILI